jgi:Fur family ferric uptake transcriptional regulator
MVTITKQRKIILAELQQLTSHPTADELFQIVRKKLPNISLGTVYRNLNQLVQDGVIIEIGRAGYKKRFDADTAKHYHFMCQQCGKVYDIHPVADDVRQIINDIEEHDVYDYDLEFYGVCKNCKTGEKNEIK